MSKTLLRLLAPIDGALRHPDVTDIVANEPGIVFVRQSGHWHRTEVPSFTFDTMDAATILIGHGFGREFDESHPYVNATMPGGQRFQGVRPPGTRDGSLLWAIRRPPAVARRFEDPDIDDMTAETNLGVTRHSQSLTSLRAAYKARNFRDVFRIARLSGMSIAFCGATGGGKSDMVRRAMQVYQPGVRMVTLETDDELGTVGPPNRATMFYDQSQMSADDAVRIVLRLIPKEIVFQEVRGPEAYVLLRAANTGHSIITTWHADEGRELEALCTMARSHPSGEMDQRLEELARRAFGIIAFCEFDDVRKKFRISSVKIMEEEAV